METPLVRLLQDPRFELVPVRDAWQHAVHLPPGARVTVTVSPRRGLDPTLDLAGHLAAHGFRVAPHLGARLVRHEAHLKEIVRRLARADIKDLFVVAGDASRPAGKFSSSVELLSALASLGHPFERIGIAGYPGGHPFLDEDTLLRALEAKQPFASYIVTQLCFDPPAIAGWLVRMRRHGITLPAYVGVPGAAEMSKLFRISIRIGVGDSIRFLRKTSGASGFLRRWLGSDRFPPEEIVQAIAPYVDDPTCKIEGLHIYTFNQVASTEGWRRRMLRIPCPHTT